MKICDFTIPELNHFRSECNFTEDEMELFNLRSKNIPMEECAEIMEISTSTVKRIHHKIWSKIDRIQSL